MNKFFCLLSLSFLVLSFKFCNAQWQETTYFSSQYIECLDTMGANLFAGTNGYGVFLSTDNGSRWNAVNNGLSGMGTWVTSMVIRDTNIFIGTYGGAYLSTDTGASWTDVSNGLTGEGIIVHSLAL